MAEHYNSGRKFSSTDELTVASHVWDPDEMQWVPQVANAPSDGGAASDVNVLNWPSTQEVSGEVDVVGEVSVSNFPATQTVAGEVSVSNFPEFPATQTVAGEVSVSNFPEFPATQVVSDGGSSITVDDGGSSITVDGTVGIGGTVTVDTHAVTQSGSWTVALGTGSSAIGTVSVAKQSLTPDAPSGTTVSTTSVPIVSANANRKGLTIQNVSNNVLYLAFNAAAVAGSGIALYPMGSFTMDEYTFYTGEVRAIASAAATAVAIQEWS